jgi:hypothetical protein
MARATVLEACEQAAQDDLSVLLSEIEKFEVSLQAGEKVRDSTLEDRLDQLGKLQQRAELYARILEKDLGDLKVKIEEVENKTMDLLHRKFSKSAP